MTIEKVTPLFVVDRIEPCLPFWCETLGYERRVEVPHEGALGFALLENGAGEIMLQTRASLEGDLPLVAARSPSALLFIEVDSLTHVQEATRGANVIVAERTTFYGMRETVVVDPAGTVIIFAQKQKE
jgi:uncharacterized glyoxalase superfamily protein PhnB